MGRTGRVVVVVAAALALAGCARRSEFIGTVITDGRAGGDGGPADADGAPPLPDTAPTVCPVDPSPDPVDVPKWSCGPDCYHQDGVDRAPFDSAPADDPRAPRIVYPPDGSVHPINLPRLTIMWERAAGAGQSAFLLTISSPEPPARLFRFYVPYAPPPGDVGPPPQDDTVFEVPSDFWRYVAHELAGTTARLEVTAHDPSVNRLARSLPVNIRFTAAPVDGTLHYLEVLEPAGIRRQRMSDETGAPLIPARSPANQHDCAGCHSLAADGSRIAFAATYAGNLTVADTADVDQPLLRPDAPPTNVSDAIAPALSPDGQLVFARSGTPGDDRVSLRNARGTVTFDTRTRDQMEGRIDYPTWAPSGTELVAGRASGLVQPAKPYLSLDGHLVIIPITGNRIGKPLPLYAEEGRLLAYPAFSPDGAWIVFVSRPAGQTSEVNHASELRLLQRSTGRVTRLGTTLAPDRATTWPRFAPHALDACRKLYLVFQSRLDYGLVLDNVLLTDKRPQLWLAEIDLRRLDASDPLSPPLWLPFQDFKNKNILPVFSR